MFILVKVVHFENFSPWCIQDFNSTVLIFFLFGGTLRQLIYAYFYLRYTLFRKFSNVYRFNNMPLLITFVYVCPLESPITICILLVCNIFPYWHIVKHYSLERFLLWRISGMMSKQEEDISVPETNTQLARWQLNWSVFIFRMKQTLYVQTYLGV